MDFYNSDNLTEKFIEDMVNDVQDENKISFASFSDVDVIHILKFVMAFWDGEKLDATFLCGPESVNFFMGEKSISLGMTKIKCSDDKKLEIKFLNNPVVLAPSMKNGLILMINNLSGEKKLFIKY